MPTVLIAGAGIGGLAAGVALSRRGWSVRIFEKAVTPRELGFGLGLSPNALAALRQLGVVDQVLAGAASPRSGEVRRTDGRVLRRGVGNPANTPTTDSLVVVLRPVLHGALLSEIQVGFEFQKGVIETDKAAIRFEDDGSRVRVHLSNGETADGDILIGADGVASTIRAALHPGEPPPRPSGYVAIRGTSPAVGALEGLGGVWYFGTGVESGIAQASPSAVYWFLSVLKNDVRDGEDAPAVLQRVTQNFDPKFHAIVGATPAADIRMDELFVRDPLDHWGRGRVTLLGDAAHPMLPYTGQGAAQALEDAAGLGRALARTGDLTAALRRYEEVRARRTRPIVLSGPRIARVTTTTSPLIGWLRNTVIRLAPQSMLMKPLMHQDKDPNKELS